MKITTDDQRAIDVLRKLDPQQREQLLDEARRQVEANRIVAKLAHIKLRTVPDRKVEKAFGAAPYWQSATGNARKRSQRRT